MALYFTKGGLIYPFLEEILVISEKLSLMSDFNQKGMYNAFWSLHGVGLSLICAYTECLEQWEEKADLWLR